jgi:hypothetical protein
MTFNTCMPSNFGRSNVTTFNLGSIFLFFCFFFIFLIFINYFFNFPFDFVIFVFNQLIDNWNQKRKSDTLIVCDNFNKEFILEKGHGSIAYFQIVTTDALSNSLEKRVSKIFNAFYIGEFEDFL